MKSLVRHSAMFFLRVFAGLAVMLLLFQSCMIYHPRGYEESFIQASGAEPLRYRTSQGEQVSWIRNPGGAGLVWLVFAGNGTRALDLVSYFKRVPDFDDDVFVHVDYPAYGECEGRPSPAAISESIRNVLPTLAKRLDLKPEVLQPRLRVFGHSLGAAAALIAMDEQLIDRGVLIAPFSSMKSMARLRVGWPLCELLHHRFDNEAAISRLQARRGCHLEVIHGTDDEVIPQAQSAALAAKFPDVITYHVVQGAFHNHILTSDRDLVLKSMAEVR